MFSDSLFEVFPVRGHLAVQRDYTVNLVNYVIYLFFSVIIIEAEFNLYSSYFSYPSGSEYFQGRRSHAVATQPPNKLSQPPGSEYFQVKRGSAVATRPHNKLSQPPGGEYFLGKGRIAVADVPGSFPGIHSNAIPCSSARIFVNFDEKPCNVRSPLVKYYLCVSTNSVFREQKAQ